jgi:hypothetical protein
MSNPADEINPFLLYRLAGGQVECALWQIQEGGRALALFLTAESAARYHTASGLSAEWKVARPGRAGLLELARTAVAAGVRHAVLDPDHEKARRLFDLSEILLAVDS